MNAPVNIFLFSMPFTTPMPVPTGQDSKIVHCDTSLALALYEDNANDFDKQDLTYPVRSTLTLHV